MIKRGSIQVDTLEKIKEFLKQQIEPVTIADIVTKLHVNRDSVNYALTLIPHKVDKQGKIKSFAKSKAQREQLR